MKLQSKAGLATSPNSAVQRSQNKVFQQLRAALRSIQVRRREESQRRRESLQWRRLSSSSFGLIQQTKNHCGTEQKQVYCQKALEKLMKLIWEWRLKKRCECTNWGSESEYEILRGSFRLRHSWGSKLRTGTMNLTEGSESSKRCFETRCKAQLFLRLLWRGTQRRCREKLKKRFSSIRCRMW